MNLLGLAQHGARSVGLMCLLFGVFGSVGCDGASSGNSGDSGDIEVADTRPDGTEMSDDDEAAAGVLTAKLAEYYVKGADGWTTQFQQLNVMGQPMPDRVPVTLYRQYRALAFAIAPEGLLTETQKLNGTEYRGIATFKDTPVRYYQTEANYEGPQGWGNWKDAYLEVMPVVVERRNGKWLTSDSELFEGIKPTSAIP